MIIHLRIKNNLNGRERENLRLSGRDVVETNRGIFLVSAIDTNRTLFEQPNNCRSVASTLN